jgi:tetratricopeptide (TPR) repeat protein
MNRKERRIAAKSGLVALPNQSGTSATASLLTVAEAHYRSGRLHEADAICASLLATEPRHAPALLMRGLISNQQGRPADAVTYLKLAVALAPTVVAVHHGLAEAYRAVAKPADAERHFRRAAELQPGAVPLLNLGNILMELRRPAAAVAVYQSALRFDARLPEIHLGMGSAFAQLRRNTEAVDAFARAIALRPGFTFAYEGMIDAFLAAGAGDAAWQAASHALMLADTPKLRMQFVSSIGSARPTSETPGLREAMQRAIAERWTRPHELARAACAIVALRRPIDLGDGLLRTLLDLAPICHREIEQALTEQRRTFLAMAASGDA